MTGMTISEFKESLSSSRPPEGLSAPLLGLWYAGSGNWEKAHSTVQEDPGPEAAWVHAHVHKQEGDLSNAAYWYARATRNTMKLSLEQEWEEIAKALIGE